MTQKKLGNVPIVGHGVFLIDKIPGGVPYFALRVFLIVTNTDSVTHHLSRPPTSVGRGETDKL
jgi:hypothetical protein